MITVIIGGLVGFLIFWKSGQSKKTNSLRKYALAFELVAFGLIIGLSASVNLGNFFLSTQVHASKTPNCWVIDNTPEKGTSFVVDTKVADKDLGPYDMPVRLYDFYYESHGKETYLLSYYHIDRRLFFIGIPTNTSAKARYHEVSHDSIQILFIQDLCTLR